MPKRIFWNDFSGGKNNVSRDHLISEKQSPSLRNVRFTKYGALSKKWGSVITRAIDSSTGGLLTLFSYRLTGMAAEAMLAVTNTGSPIEILKSTAPATADSFSSAFNITGESQTTEKRPINFLIFKDLVYAFAHFMNTWSYDNSSGTEIAASGIVFPRSRYACVWKDRIFCAYIYDGSADRFSRVKWSDFNAVTFTSTNFQDFYADDGNVVTGLFPFGNELIIWKGPDTGSEGYSKSRMFTLTGETFDAQNPTYSYYEIIMPPGVGIWPGSSYAIYEGKLIFLTNDGWYQYSGGGVPPVNISETIRGDYEKGGFLFSQLSDLDSNPVAVVFEGRYHCAVRCSSLPGSDSGKNQYVFTLDGDSWLVDCVSSDADDFTVADDGPMSFTVWGSDLYSSTLRSLTSGRPYTRIMDAEPSSNVFSENPNEATVDHGATLYVNSFYRTKEFVFPGEVTFVRCWLHLRRQTSGTLTFRVNTDQRGTVSNSVDMTAGDSGTTENSSSLILRKEVNIGRPGRTIQFEFWDANNNDFEIYGIELEYEEGQR